MPVACISAYAVVGPTKRKPLRFNAFAIAVDSGVTATTSAVVTGAGRSRLGANDHSSASRPPSSATTARRWRWSPAPSPVAHDAGVGQQPRDVAVVERRHRGRVEAGEGRPERRPLAQDRDPRQPGLERLEADPLEQRVPRRAPAGPTRRRGTPCSPAIRRPTGSGPARPDRAPRRVTRCPRRTARTAAARTGQRPQHRTHQRPAQPAERRRTAGRPTPTRRPGTRPARTASTSKAPEPRTSFPVCRTTARCGGSQTVIIIVSRKPSRPIPVKAEIVSPSAATALGPGEQHPAVVDVPVGEHVPDLLRPAPRPPGPRPARPPGQSSSRSARAPRARSIRFAAPVQLVDQPVEHLVDLVHPVAAQRQA